jgi:hypothetical protein
VDSTLSLRMLGFLFACLCATKTIRWSVESISFSRRKLAYF